VIASLQGLGHAVEAMSATAKLSERQQKAVDEGISGFSSKRDDALNQIKEFQASTLASTDLP
jgi:hypothetical protein